MKNFPTDIAKTRIKRGKFPISSLFLCDFEEYFPTLSMCGEFLHRLYRSLFFYHSRMTKLGDPYFLSFENDEVEVNDE